MAAATAQRVGLIATEGIPGILYRDERFCVKLI
jgi:hypothetical protein